MRARDITGDIKGERVGDAVLAGERAHVGIAVHPFTLLVAQIHADDHQPLVAQLLIDPLKRRVSSLHGMHQLPQKLTTTILPL